MIHTRAYTVSAAYGRIVRRETRLSILTRVDPVSRSMLHVHPWGHARLPCARAPFQVWAPVAGFPPSTSGSVPRAMPALRWQATHSWEDDNLVLCCIADLVVPAERTAERQPKNRGKDLLVHAPQCPSPALRCPRSLEAQPRPSDSLRVWLSCLLLGPRFFLLSFLEGRKVLSY